MSDDSNNPNLSDLDCGPLIITGLVHVDDQSDIYVGDCKQVTQLVGRQRYEINDIEELEFEANFCDYLYFVCWSNDKGRNGFLAELTGSGGNKILSGSDDWEVFATGIDKDTSTDTSIPDDTVSQVEINQQLKRACRNGWSKPFVGPPNTPSASFFQYKPAIDTDAKHIWHNSGKDTRSLYPAADNVPFVEFDHDEFLIFRLPVSALFQERCTKCRCNKCECESCEEIRQEVNDSLDDRCGEMAHQLELCSEPSANDSNVSGECKQIVDLDEVSPQISIHWGDSANDCLETDDFEVMCIRVCNPYSDFSFNNFRIEMLQVVDEQGDSVAALPDGTPSVQLVPMGPYYFGDIPPCDSDEANCISREFTVKTLGAAAGNYQIALTGICFNLCAHKKENSCMKLTLVKS